MKSTLGADVYSEVSYALLEIFQAIDRILALFPQSLLGLPSVSNAIEVVLASISNSL